MSHECVIGLLANFDYELVTIPELKDHIAERIQSNKTMRLYGLESKEWTMNDYADCRKSTNLSRFRFCPECGKKIDWKALRREA